MNLQPLHVCMSYQTTLNLLDRISEDHDVNVTFWADDLMKNIEKQPQQVYQLCGKACTYYKLQVLSLTMRPTPSYTYQLADDDSSEEESINAPAYSPLSSRSVTSQSWLHCLNSCSMPAACLIATEYTCITVLEVDVVS